MNIEEVTKLLARTEACARLDDDERTRIARAGGVQVAFAGDTLLEEGAAAESMLLLLDGDVVVVKRDDEGGEREIATLGAGSVLGEVALLSEGPRSATIRAKTPVRYFEIDRTSFETLIEGQDSAAVKMLHSLARSLARRQKRTNDKLVDLLARVAELEETPDLVSSSLGELVIEFE